MKKNKYKKLIFTNEKKLLGVTKRGDILKDYDFGDDKAVTSTYKIFHSTVWPKQHKTLESHCTSIELKTANTSKVGGLRSINNTVKKSIQTTIQRTLTYKEGTLSSIQDTIQSLPSPIVKMSSKNLVNLISVHRAIEKQKTKAEKDAQIIRNARLKEEMLREEKKEERDNIFESFFQEAKQKAFIRDFLKSKDTRVFKEGFKDDGFYRSKENLINFKNDCLLVPSIRNHMVNQFKTLEEKMNILTLPNSIDMNTQLNLNLLKRKCQKTKDDKKLTEEINSKKDIVDLKIEEVYRRIYGAVPKLVNIDTYDYNDYLLYKYDRYNEVNFASSKIKDIVLNLS
jgi:hypothetical protein